MKKQIALILVCLLAGGMVFAGGAQEEQAETTGGSRINAWGVELPADALPAEEQMLVLPSQAGKHMDMSGHFYEADKSGGGVFMFESMLYLDENSKVLPGAAESWEMDGDKWIFNLRKNAKWSDGTPVTAKDFEFALKRALDPATGNNWVWYYSDIKNYSEVTGGEMSPDDLPVYATDDYTLVVETNGKVPYFDQIMAYPSSIPIPRHMYEEHGDAWATKAETCLSNGPWKLAAYTPGLEIELVPNEHYNGFHKPYIERFSFKPGDGVSDFPAYQSGAVDALFADQDTTPISPANYRFVSNDPELSKELYAYPYFMTRYVYFDTNVEPWNDVKVREAVTRALDGQAMIDVIYDGLGQRAYGMLPPGFPGYEAGKNDKYQALDVDKAKKLLAEAGYPNGQGFPKVELWVKTYEDALPKTAEMVQEKLKKNLGVNIDVRPVESKFFNSSMAKGSIDFGIQNWQYDYVDPSNFLNVWHPDLGRHKDWNNAEFNELVEKAQAWPDPEERIELYSEADSVLSADYGGGFLYHSGQAQMWKPYVKGLSVDMLGNERVPYYFLGMHSLYKVAE